MFTLVLIVWPPISMVGAHVTHSCDLSAFQCDLVGVSTNITSSSYLVHFLDSRAIKSNTFFGIIVLNLEILVSLKGMKKIMIEKFPANCTDVTYPRCVLNHDVPTEPKAR